MINTIQKSKLFIHIGDHKTGSTSLQLCMTRNQELLAKNEIAYIGLPKAKFQYQHAHLCESIVNEYIEKNYKTLKLTGDTEFTEPPSDMINRMLSTFYSNNFKTLILSSETFLNPGFRPVPVDENLNDNFLGGIKQSQKRNYVIQYLKTAFAEFDTKIICYVRRQDEYIESLYNQRCREMSTKAQFEKWCGPSERFKPDRQETAGHPFFKTHTTEHFRNFLLRCCYSSPEYDCLLADWAAVFGKENIIVRPFEKSQLPHGVEYDFFVNALGQSPDFFEQLSTAKRANESVNKEVLEFKLQTRLFGLKQEFKELAMSPGLPPFVKENGRKNMLTASQAEHVRTRFAPCNEKIAREYLGREDGVLFYDPSRDPKDDYPGLSLASALAISKELMLMLKNKDKWLNASIYADYGNGYSEKDRTALPVHADGSGCFTARFALPKAEGVAGLRFDPDEGRALEIAIDSVVIDGCAKSAVPVNHSRKTDDFDTFLTGDPQYILSAPPQCTEVIISGRIRPAADAGPLAAADASHCVKDRRVLRGIWKGLHKIRDGVRRRVSCKK